MERIQCVILSIDDYCPIRKSYHTTDSNGIVLMMNKHYFELTLSIYNKC